MSPSCAGPGAGALAALGMLAALATPAAGPALAYVPPADKIAAAVARQNADQGRARPLVLEVALRGADGEVEAVGELATRGPGTARLELREPQGAIERQLLARGRILATRNGRRIPDPRPLLPPLSLLQARSGAELRGGIAELGGEPDRVDLGHIGPEDCFVLGGRERERSELRPVREGAASPEAARPRLTTDVEGPGGQSDSRSAPERSRATATRPGPSSGVARTAVWASIESYEILRIDRAGEAIYQMGPLVAFGDVRLPSWIGITGPRGSSRRLEIRSVADRPLEPGAFRKEWLEEAVAPPTAPSEPHEGPGGAVTP